MKPPSLEDPNEVRMVMAGWTLYEPRLALQVGRRAPLPRCWARVIDGEVEIFDASRPYRPKVAETTWWLPFHVPVKGRKR